MYINGINYPNELIEALNEGTLVVFAGAGVSKGEPTSLPDFEELAIQIAEGTGIERSNQDCDVFLGKLKHKKINVNQLAASILSGLELSPNSLHKNIIDLFPDTSKIKIVTTNYDNMFEHVLREKNLNTIKIYDTPALPLGNDISGVIHIHGNVQDYNYMVLTDEDFGMAYLSEGYTSRFLVKLFETYTVLFIGYSYKDIIVRYLTRAMTRYQSKKRYILTDTDPQSWEELGIEPIIFPPQKYDDLDISLNQLGERIKRGLLDWKSNLTLISEAPPNDLSIESEINYCLQDIDKTRILANCINNESWIWWLDKKDVFKNLFAPKAILNEMDSLWLDWIITNFVGKNDPLLKELIQKYNNQINVAFANRILDKIAAFPEEFSNDSIKMYYILLEKHLSNPWILYELNNLAMNKGLHSIGWELFKKQFQYKIILKKKIFPFDNENFYFDHQILGDPHFITELWEKFSLTYIDNYPLQVLHFATGYIMNLHNSYEQLGAASKDFEPHDMIYDISLEDESKGFYHEKALAVIGNACIISFKKIELIESIYIKWHVQQCIKSESTLLRIIGIKLLRETKQFDPNEKAILLTENIDLYSIWEKEQIFKQIAEIFDLINPVLQDSILNRIEKGKIFKNKQTSAYEKYNWCIWLQKNCRKNERVEALINKIKEEYPYFQPRNHPELDIDSSGISWGKTISPFSENELLMMEYEEIIQYLNTYKGDKWDGPNREGLLTTFASCISQNFSWTINILGPLKENVPHNSDVWCYFFRGLDNLPFELDKMMKVLNQLTDIVFLENRGLDLSRLLEKIIDSEDMQTKISHYEEELFKISQSIWNKNKAEYIHENLDLVSSSINCCTGLLTLIWVKMISHSKYNCIPDKYKTIFEKVLLEATNKDIVICTLAGQSIFLYNLDREWFSKHLLPYFTSDSTLEFKAAWEGFTILSSRMQRELADEMLPIYANAVKRLDELGKEARKGFVDQYTLLMVYVIPDPIKIYIPGLFNVSSKENRLHFIQCINRVLHSMDSKKKHILWNSWLEKYWRNRIKNIPIPLETYESDAMLEWIFQLDDLYPNAIDLIIGGPKVKDITTNFWHRLNNFDQATLSPDSTADLLVFLLNSDTNLRHRESTIKELAQKISCCNPIKYQSLKESMLKRIIPID